MLAILGAVLFSPQIQADKAFNSGREETGDEKDHKIVSLLVYLDSIEDNLENREVLAWTAPLVHSNVLVEFMTGTREIKQSSSPIVDAIVHSNCALRSIPFPHASREEMDNFARYVQKFDLVVAVACAESQSQCWERVGTVTALKRGTSDQEPEASLTAAAAAAAASPKRILYLPASAEQQVCEEDSGTGLQGALLTGHWQVVMVRLSLFCSCYFLLYSSSWRY